MSQRIEGLSAAEREFLRTQLLFVRDQLDAARDETVKDKSLDMGSLLTIDRLTADDIDKCNELLERLREDSDA